MTSVFFEDVDISSGTLEGYPKTSHTPKTWHFDFNEFELAVEVDADHTTFIRRTTQHTTWLTHQEEIEVDEEVLVTEVEVVIEVVDVVAEEEVDEVVTSQKKRNGNRSPNLDVSSKQERSFQWNRSIFTHFQSKSIKSLISSSPDSRTKS